MFFPSKVMVCALLCGDALIELSSFLQAGMNLRKVNRHVDFPLMLDLAPFCSATCKVLIRVIHISQDQ